MEEVFEINPNNIESVLFGIIDRDEELLDIIYYHNQKEFLEELKKTDWSVLV